MALDHRRIIRPGKKIPPEFFAFDKFILQNLTNKSGCVYTNLLYHLYITSDVKQYYEAMRHCFYHTDLGQQNAVFHNIAIQIAIQDDRSTRGL